MIYCRSQIAMADITDGTSNTFLLGEKYINPDHYFTGLDLADDAGVFEGHKHDVDRGTATVQNVPLPPLPDTPGNMALPNFGSAHTIGLHMSLCDGSVQFINYSIDPLVFSYLGNRKDGMAIDGKEF